MSTPSPKTVYEHLQKLEDADAEHSAVYRKEAYDVITNPAVSDDWQEKICDRLNRANQVIALSTVEPGESY
ncbi:MAG: hypothetical protein AAGF24_14370 [Cyanobacteria bacterium P01_H01_bin.121]